MRLSGTLLNVYREPAQDLAIARLPTSNRTMVQKVIGQHILHEHAQVTDANCIFRHFGLESAVARS